MQSLSGNKVNERNTTLPLVSIVTPSLNQAQFIGQTIESVLGQDYSCLEYWVVDGGSTDGTLDILDQFKTDQRFHWLSEPDEGQADAINKGWHKCNGEIIAWLNSDDMYKPNAISKAVNAFNVNRDAVIVCGSALIINAHDDTIGNIPAPHLSLDQMLLMKTFLPQPAVFMQAFAVEQAGGVNTKLQYAMDFDLFLRLAKSGKIIYLDDYLTEYREHDHSKTSTQFYELRREAAQVARNFIKSLNNNNNYYYYWDNARRKSLLSYAYLVEAYANYRLGNYFSFLTKTFIGVALSPANISWVARRAIKHAKGSQ